MPVPFNGATTDRGVLTSLTPRVGANLTAMAMQCSLNVGAAEKRYAVLEHMVLPYM
jgi:hypothetical protein